MSLPLQDFKLYDTDILDLLWTGSAVDALTRTEPPEDCEGVFDDLQEKDLICSIYRRNYPRAYSLLRRLDHTLLLDACQSLPAARRNLLLPHIQKTANYSL